MSPSARPYKSSYKPRLKGLAAGIVGIACALGLFYAMSLMVAPPSSVIKTERPALAIDFTSRRKDSDTETRSRALPPPPPDVPPPPSNTAISNQPAQQSVPELTLQSLNANIAIDGLALGGDLLAGVGQGDAEVMPLVRPPAVYPARAKMRGIEGVVKARLTIRPDGTVSNVEIVSAEPEGVFEREAMRAMYRYRFSPKMQNGIAVGQTATQTLEFRLQ
ncbi:MAG: energy transducer TonB [Thalassolituus sp.]